MLLKKFIVITFLEERVACSQMKVSDSLQYYLDFGIYRIGDIDYIEGKNAKSVMSGDCHDEKLGECDFEILDVGNGKFIKALTNGTNLIYHYLTKEEIIELQKDLEYLTSEENGMKTITVDLNEILDPILETADFSKITRASIEKCKRNWRYERIERIKKTNSEYHNLDVYNDSIHRLFIAVIGDSYENEFPMANDTSYINLKKLMRECWANFTHLTSAEQINISNGDSDVRLCLISTASLIEDEEMLEILENYKSPIELKPLDKRLFVEARKRARLYKEIYEKININEEYQRSKFIKEISQNNPEVFDESIPFHIGPFALLKFWHIDGKIHMYKKGRLYYFHKGCENSNAIPR